MVTATASAGYIFSGWGGDLSGVNNPATVTVNSNKNITANFVTETSKFTINIALNPANGGTVSLSPAQPVGGYVAGAQVTLTATANSGYGFSHWTGDVTGNTNPASFAIFSNKNITANFSAATGKYNLVVTISPQAAGIVNASPVQPSDGYPAGTQVTLTATGNSGFVFSGWSGDLAGGSNPGNITMNSNKNVTAFFVVTGGGGGGGGGIPILLPTRYGLTINNPGGGTINLRPGQPRDGYIAGTAVTVIANPDIGYIFSSWSGDLTGDSNPATITMNAHKNITVNFTETVYKLVATSSPPSAGIVHPEPAQPDAGYPAGTSVTLYSRVNTGYIFKGWAGDLVSNETPVTFAMNSNKTIYSK
jgi:uncharacterized repeat protein (TIGR02543 family)